MRMYELAMVVDLARKVGVVLFGRLEHDLAYVSLVLLCLAVRRTLEPLVSLWDAR